MAWVGTGAMWTMVSGVLKGVPLEQAARGAMEMGGMSGLRFVQISDSLIGFNKPADADVTATLRAAVTKIKAAVEPPSFVLHTGDLTHLAKPAEFDTLQQVLGELSLPVFYVPGEPDVFVSRTTARAICNGLEKARKERAGTASTRAVSTSSGSSMS